MPLGGAYECMDDVKAVSVHTCIYVHMYVGTCVCTYVHCACAHMCMTVHVCECAYEHAHVGTCQCICIHV